MTPRIFRSFSVLAPAIAVVLASASLAPAQGNDEWDDDFRWVRLSESQSRVLRMGVGYRTYERENGPSVTLVGAVHIGDPRFYSATERRLDAHDVILFEGVGPPGSGANTDDLKTSEKVEWSERRVRLLAMLATRVQADTGEYPESLSELKEALSEREGAWIENASTDAWGNAIEYGIVEGELDIVSLGKDGEPGGRGASGDLRLSDMPALSRAETGDEPGIQKRIAETFDLTFQLDEMNHVGDKYINSDLSIDEVDRLIRDSGGDGSMLFDMIGGEGFMTAIAGVVLELIERLPGVAVRGKVMLMEMLGNSEDIFEAGIPGMEGLFEVLIERRNERVMDDLARLIEQGDEYENGIAIIYGAGHMKDMERRLRERFGYKPVDEGWTTAMRVNLAREGISETEMRFIRMSIQQQLSVIRSRTEH